MGTLCRLARGVAVIGVVSSLVGASKATAQIARSSGSPSVLSGKIAALDLKRNALKVEAAKPITGQPAALSAQPNLFLLNEQTVISKGGQPLKAEQLKVGDQVRIAYVEQVNQHVAQSITVQESPDANRAAQPEGSRTPQPSPESRSW